MSVAQPEPVAVSPSTAASPPTPAVIPAPISSPATAASELKLRVEFSGGLELLFNRQKAHTIVLPITDAQPASSLTMRYLIDYLKNNVCTERHELFVAEDSVRPGILVLINDTDWELAEGLEYQLKAGDTIVFISTLHGG